MKKLITLFALLITSSVVCLFAQNTEYDSLMQKAKDYESQKKYVYAMGTYWDAILATEDYEEAYEAHEKYTTLVEEFVNGKPGLDEYDEFSIYDGWMSALDEFVSYWTENNPFIIKFDELKKGPLNYETRTTEYTIQGKLEGSNKFGTMYRTLLQGYFSKSQTNWSHPIAKYENKKKDSFPFEGRYESVEFPLDFSMKNFEEMAKKKQGLVFYQEEGKYRFRNCGFGYFTQYYISGGTETYSYLVSTDGNPIKYTVNGPLNAKKVTSTREVKGEIRSCLTLSLNIVDSDGSILLSASDIPWKFRETGSVSSWDDGFFTKFENVSADLMRKIDAKNYSIVPVSIKIKYGYLPKELSKNLKELENLSEKEMPIFIEDATLDKFDKMRENYKKDFNEKLSKEIKKLEKEYNYGYDKKEYLEYYMDIYTWYIPGTDIDISLGYIGHYVDFIKDSIDYDYLDKLTNHNTTKYYCNKLSKAIGLEPYYYDDSFEPKPTANGWRIISEKELKKAVDFGFITEKEATSSNTREILVRKHNEQKSNSLKKKEENVKVDEEAKRLELEKLAEENRLKYDKAEEERKLKLEEQNKKIQAEKQRELEERNKQTDERFVAYDKNPWKGDVEYDDLQRYVNCYLKDLKKNITIQVVNIQQPEIFNKMPFNLNQSYSGKNKITFDFRKVNFQEAWPYYKGGDKTNRTDYTQIQFIYRSINSFDGYISAVIFPKTLQDIIQKKEPQLLEKLNKQYPKAGSIIKFK